MKKARAEVFALLKLQGGCAICRAEITRFGRGGWAQDHDHKTGLFRGVLCFECNAGLGLFKDDPRKLYHAIHYLEAHKRAVSGKGFKIKHAAQQPKALMVYNDEAGALAS